MTKKLLLTSAAALVATAGAQAADLPVKAKAVEYVKVCTLYGAAFYYIPGTDTCIRIGGHLRSEIGWNTGGTHYESYDDGNGNATGGRDRDYFFTRQRVYLDTDTRTISEWGTVRTYSEIRFTFNILNPYVASSPTNVYGTAGLSMQAGYIQWGGFTIGKLYQSFFDTPWSAYASSYTPQTSIGTSDTTDGVFTLGYTYQFGNGVSGTLALQEAKQLRFAYYNAFNPLGPAGSGPSNSAGGEHAPDIVGVIGIKQAWGEFQVSGMARDLTFLYNGNALAGVGGFGCLPAGSAAGSWCTGHQSDVWGFAGQAGIKINLPWGVDAQDAFYLNGGYSHGIVNAVYNTSNATGIGIFNGASGGGGPNSLFFGYIADVVFAANGPFPGTSLSPQLTNAWGVNGTLEHNWSNKWKTSVTAGYGEVNYDAAASNALCNKFGAGVAGVAPASAGSGTLAFTNCNFNIHFVGVSTRTRWEPVKDFQIGLELQWARFLNQLSGIYTTPAAGIADGSGVPIVPGGQSFFLGHQDIISGYLSFRRYF